MEKGKKWGRYDAYILVRMEKALKEEIERLAVAEDLPVSTTARRLLRRGLDAEKKKSHPPKK